MTESVQIGSQTITLQRFKLWIITFMPTEWRPCILMTRGTVGRTDFLSPTKKTDGFQTIETKSRNQGVITKMQREKMCVCVCVWGGGGGDKISI